MASTCSTTLSISSSSSTLVDAAKAAPRQSAAAAPSATQCVSLPALPHLAASRPSSKAATYCRKIARNVMAMATAGDAAPAEDVELPEFVKTVQEAWDKVEDKYAVSSLAAAGALAVWSSSGMISAIDRLPLVPGVLELVGIGYTGWFAYKNLFFKPDREALIQKVKDTYKDVIGSS